jgi:hypothetical protein
MNYDGKISYKEFVDFMKKDLEQHQFILWEWDAHKVTILEKPLKSTIY